MMWQAVRDGSAGGAWCQLGIAHRFHAGLVVLCCLDCLPFGLMRWKYGIEFFGGFDLFRVVRAILNCGSYKKFLVRLDGA